MSNESVRAKVAETIIAINTQIDGLGDTPTVSEVEGIIRGELTRAYNETAADDRPYLFRQFSIALHPDKCASRHDALSRVIVTNADFKRTPRQVLWHVNTNIDLLHAFTSDPIDASMSMSDQFFLGFKGELEQCNRYMEPIASMVCITQITIDVLLTYALVAGLNAGCVMKALAIDAKVLNHYLFNLATANQFDAELEMRITPDLLAKAALLLLRGFNVDTSLLVENKEIMTAYYDKVTAAGLTREDADVRLCSMAKSSASQGFTGLSAMKDAVWHHLNIDLPPNTVDNGLAIIYRALLAVLFIPFAGISVSLELISRASAIPALALIFTSVLVKTAATLLLNSPLYAWDGLTYLANALVSTLSQIKDMMSAYFTAEANPHASFAFII